MRREVRPALGAQRHTCGAACCARVSPFKEARTCKDHDRFAGLQVTGRQHIIFIRRLAHCYCNGGTSIKWGTVDRRLSLRITIIPHRCNTMVELSAEIVYNSNMQFKHACIEIWRKYEYVNIEIQVT